MIAIRKENNIRNCIIIKREHIINTFAAHKEYKNEYGSISDSIMNFALRTKYNIDAVRKERKFRQLV